MCKYVAIVLLIAVGIIVPTFWQSDDFVETSSGSVSFSLRKSGGRPPRRIPIPVEPGQWGNETYQTSSEINVSPVTNPINSTTDATTVAVESNKTTVVVETNKTRITVVNNSNPVTNKIKETLFIALKNIKFFLLYVLLLLVKLLVWFAQF